MAVDGGDRFLAISDGRCADPGKIPNRAFSSVCPDDQTRFNSSPIAERYDSCTLTERQVGDADAERQFDLVVMIFIESR